MSVVTLPYAAAQPGKNAAMVATARSSPVIFRFVNRSPSQRITIRVLTTKLSCPIGVTTLASPDLRAASRAISPVERQKLATKPWTHP